MSGRNGRDALSNSFGLRSYGLHVLLWVSRPCHVDRMQPRRTVARGHRLRAGTSSGPALPGLGECRLFPPFCASASTSVAALSNRAAAVATGLAAVCFTGKLHPTLVHDFADVASCRVVDGNDEVEGTPFFRFRYLT